MNSFKNLFKERGIKDVITLFHSPSSQASVRAHTILKQAVANSAAHATEDQATDPNHKHPVERHEFELDVQEEPPTSTQLSSILEYLGSNSAGSVIKGAADKDDALDKFRSSQTAFQRPVTVDWNHGRAVVGDNESEILKLVRQAGNK
ncbi:hypothetical protein K470DRAFT_216423 [Piedraia hortae CBS 480.64]|uniref:DUF1687-domain-containing protein n=1 Tax=Piedraia hortae CBS 480.64 TaxID=1314780 RepID=A0A6A7C0B6_9PEZI|nr:hypothetical protein K470DRAFT_216423 [Piedraia hortae CBS 480.64]